MRSLNTTRSMILSVSTVAACWVSCILIRLPAFPWLILMPLLIISVLTDVAWKFIPNWLTGSAAAALILLALLAGTPTTSESVLSGLAITFTVSMVLYATMGLGAGDVKLAACIGACLGPGPAMTMLFSAYIVAGIAAILTVTFRWALPFGLRGLELSGLDSVASQFDRYYCSNRTSRKQPMAPWFAVGTLLTIF